MYYLKILCLTTQQNNNNKYKEMGLPNKDNPLNSYKTNNPMTNSLMTHSLIPMT